ncbi:hypothetical protein FKM82_001778, partial [Ascaphus truei]
AFDKGDDRRLAKKPIFTSSQVNLKKRSTEGYLSNTRKMKSDSLGASGHTLNTTRNSSGKGKEDDLKGKDGKKALTKDLKPAEKMVTTKPKAVLKTKSEKNGSVKTESGTAKGDSASSQKYTSSVKGGARPKAPNGNPNSQTKVKTLKKAERESASHVGGTVPSMKSTNSNGKPLHSNKSEEQNLDSFADKQQNSAHCSPQSGNPLKNNLDGSKDLGVGDHEPTSQKKKGIKISNCAAQRPKSAPAAISKQQGLQGDGANPLKSVSSKQTKVKSDIRLMNSSASTDKPVALNKKTIKPALAPTHRTGAKPAMPISKNNLIATKGFTANYKELKQKVLTQSHSSKASHPKLRQEHNDSPTVLKNGSNQHILYLDRDLRPDVIENPQVNKKKCKQAIFSQSVELSGSFQDLCFEDLAFTACECQENSIGNQDYKIQKPNSEHCNCQESVPAASAQLYASNSKEILIEVRNRTEVEKVDSIKPTGVNSVLDISDPKPQGKNICDSENSNRCVDSSSESELCSVKEVEKNTPHKDQLEMNETFLKCPQNIKGTLDNSGKMAESFLQGFSTNHQSTLTSKKHSMNCISDKQVPDFPRDMNIRETMESHDNSEMKFVGHWNKHTGTLQEKESPESDSGSASTSSDDIKPRSEDYDAGGSQDDDGSNERGISKCSTMRCHDFLGRSSSDTSTPEELKGYDGSLRIDVKMKKEHSSDIFRVNSTSDDEGPRKRPEMWLQRGVSKHSVNQNAACSNIQCPPEMEHVSSSADETEDERSEAENAAEKALSDVASQQFQGIINLAFDDLTEIDNEGQQVPGNKTCMRSVLLSVDECEELGSDEGEPDTSQMHTVDSRTPSDVFDNLSNEHSGYSHKEGGFTEHNLQNGGKQLQKHLGGFSDPCLCHKEFIEDSTSLTADKNKAAETLPKEALSYLKGQGVAEAGKCKGYYKHPESEFKSQARPCHLDLYTTDSPSDTHKFCSSKTVTACTSQFLDYQVNDTHASPTESSNTALPAGHIDDFDSLAQSCMYGHRPSKSLSPINEVDAGEGFEQRMKTEATNIMDFAFEDQHFVQEDWTLLRQLLADHGSNVDVINSVPEDLSLAQYLINQTLLLARENSKSQGNAHVDNSSRWGELGSSPFDDSTSVTLTSLSPDDCSSPHGEWTILELETHH